MQEYVIQQGDTFYGLSKRYGGNYLDWQRANRGLNPEALQVGQKIKMPGGRAGQSDHYDEIEMEVEGIKFRVKRVGEGSTPHEVHLLVPRIEIRKCNQNPALGTGDVEIMLSNVNIIHSPRILSGEAPKLAAGEEAQGSPAEESGFGAAQTFKKGY